MTTFTWSITSMETSTQTIDGYTDVVLTAQWMCFGTETTGSPAKVYNANANGTCSFPIPASGGTFTPYPQLTQTQVLDWCYANGVDQTQIESVVQTTIDNLTNPTQEQMPLPWQTFPMPTDVLAA
jgi:hypothetical protein